MLLDFPASYYGFQFSVRTLFTYQMKVVKYANALSPIIEFLSTLGVGAALSDNPELGTLYLLLGRPSGTAHVKQYQNARRLLQEHLKVRHELVEEDNADRLAETVAALMKQHTT